MENEFQFETPNSGRWILLGKMDQQFPTGTFSVTDVRPSAKRDGAAILTLKDHRTGDEVTVYAFPRDVRGCIEQYGVKPTGWVSVRFAPVEGANRMQLVPEKQPLTEEYIGQ